MFSKSESVNKKTFHHPNYYRLQIIIKYCYMYILP